MRKKSIETERYETHNWEFSTILHLSHFLHLNPRIKNLSSQLAKIDIAQHKKEESEKAKV